METTVQAADMYSSCSTLALFAELLASHPQEAAQQAVVNEIQQRAQHGSHTAAIVQALLTIHADTSRNMLYSLLELAMSPNYSNAVISSNCAAACQALTAAFSCCPLVEDELQRQLLKASEAAEGLMLAGLEQGSPAAKKLSVQVCLQLFKPAVGQRRIASSVDGVKWLQSLLAVMGMEQVAAAAAASSDSNCHQQLPEPSLVWVVLEAINRVTEHMLTTEQLCQKPYPAGTGRKGAKQCSCAACLQLQVMNLKPLLRAMQHGSSKAAASLGVLAKAAGVQRQLVTQQGMAELLCTSWQHRDSATGANTEQLLRQLVQQSSLGSCALEQHMQAVVAALEQYQFLSPTDLAQTLAGCLALLKIAATPGAVEQHLVQCVHDAIGGCIPSLVELADFSIVQQDDATPATAATLLLEMLAKHQPQLLTVAIVKQEDSLKRLLAALDSTEGREGGSSTADLLLLAATTNSVHGSVDVLMALGEQPHLDSLVQ
jgi:hypothetical protein